MPLITGNILDSGGRPANGLLRARVSRPFVTAKGMVTMAVHQVQVRGGQFEQTGGVPFSLPATPEGVWMRLEEDFDGYQVMVRGVFVPDQESVEYSDLVLNVSTVGEIDGGSPDGPAEFIIDGGTP